MAATGRQQTTASRSRRGWRSFAFLFMVLALAASVAQQSSLSQSDERNRGARNAGVRPKRISDGQAKRTTQLSRSTAAIKSSGAKAGVGLETQAAAVMAATSSAPLLASVDFNLVGLAATASPSTQTIPKNTPTVIHTGMQTLPGSDPAHVIATLNPNYRIRGELTGPSFTAPVVVEAPIGQPLQIPQLTSVGDHIVQNLRIVDSGAEGAPLVGAVVPDSAGIVVIDQVLISEVRVTELSYDEIIRSGININDDSYSYYNFTLGIGTTSNVQRIDIPVAFPPTDAVDPRPVIGVPHAPLGTEVPDIFPIMMEPVGGGGEMPDIPELEMPGGGGISIPGVVVFPGRVGFLQQHFEAVVLVANGSPQNSGLVVKQLRAKITLPTATDGGPPLAIAETQVGGRVEELALHGLGQDGRYGTADDTDVFPSGASGQAGFLLKGLRQGLHTVDFELKAVLEGLASGPLNIAGRVSGAVLVRDPSIAITFTHPSVVRKDQEYDLSMTLFNQSSRDLQGALAQLSQGSISGATLLGDDTGQRSFDTTIKGGETSTISWRLKSLRTGAVTASYVTINNGATATLGLVTGVGDRGVPLSPDSLALPEQVKYLPKDVVDAATAVLGQAWSIATSPPGSLPNGVVAVSKATVLSRASELGVAGVRVRFGEPVSVSLETVMRDWLGESQETPDRGFADVLRNTPAGYRWYDSVGTYLYQKLSDGQMTPTSLSEEFAAAEMPRSPFISALVTQANGAGIVGARLVETSSGRGVGLGVSAEERTGDFGEGFALRLSNSSGAQTLGQMFAVSDPSRGEWALELNGWRDGVADVLLSIPSGGTTYRQITFNGISFNSGRRYRVKFRPFTSSPPVLQEFVDGAFRDTNTVGGESSLAQPQPRVVGAVQISPEVLDGGDGYGRLIGVLFSNPMSKDSAETASKYVIGGGALRNSTEQVGGSIKVTGAKTDFGDRFVFLALDAPVGPYISRDITVNGVNDVRSQRVSQSRADIVATVSPQGNPPGAYLTGRVQLADGTPVGNAPVGYWPQGCGIGGASLALSVPITVQRTDDQGRYVIDYVRNGDCGPVVVTATHPVSGSTKQLISSVVYDGQHMVLDPVFIARGKAEGTISLGANPAPRAYVRLIPDLDIVGGQLLQADEQGRYTAGNLPVGHVSVLAVGAGSQSNATGLAVGTIEGSGRTTQINVSLSDISGTINGRVIVGDGANTPVPGVLVVAFAPFTEAEGNTFIIRSVGYAFADREGRFTIRNLPIKNITLVARDAARGETEFLVPLTQNSREVSGVQLIYPTQSFGAVSGKVIDENGTPIANADVRIEQQQVKSNAAGEFSFVKVAVGSHDVVATAPETGMIGYNRATVRANETVSNLQIVVATPATVKGHVFIQRNGETPTPVANATVTVDGLRKATTDGQGAYTLNNVVGNQSYVIRFVHPDGNLAINQPMVVSSGETVVRNATFRPASVRGKISQPDGVTGTVAQVVIHTSKPDAYGFLQQNSINTQSLPDGTFALDDMNPGAYRVTAYNIFFPTPVSNGGTLGNNEAGQCDLTLVNTLTGKIQGRVFQPDGTPVGAGVQVSLSSSSFPELVVPTNATGHFEFAEVVPTGGYALTATDPATNRTNRRYVSVQSNTDATFDITLLGHGGLRVRVLDASGNPAQSGSVQLRGTDYPNEERFAALEATSGGAIEFDGLPQGSYAVSGTSLGLSGREAVTVMKNSVAEVTIRLAPSGTVKGRVLMPGGTVGVGLADVSLIMNDRIVGVVTTSDADGQVGNFSFTNVPTAPFTLEAFDNRSGRRGRATGRIYQQGEIGVVDVQLVPLGAVAGRVTANGVAVRDAVVNLQTHGGLQNINLQVTSDVDGRFRFTGIPAGSFTVKVENGPGGLTGQTTGEVTGTTEPLPDTIADIALQASVTLVGTVEKYDGTGALAGALVSASSPGRSASTIADENGQYRFDFFPNSSGIRLRAMAPSGYDRGEVVLAEEPEPGSTVTTNVQLSGIGAVGGDVLDHLGNSLSAGTVTLVNSEWGSNDQITLTAPVQVDGRYLITGAPAGNFTLTLTIPNSNRSGTAEGMIEAEQTIELPVSLQDAGTVTGTVRNEAGTPVASADVTLYVKRPTSYYYDVVRFTHTDAQGVFTLANVPLGLLQLEVFDPSSNNRSTVTGRSLQTNNETFDYGVITMDTQPPTVESITPADGATGLSAYNTVIKVRFSEPVRENTAHEGTIKILGGTAVLTPRAFISADKREVTLRRDPYHYYPVWLSDSTTYTVVVTTQVKDLANHPVASEVRSTFTTGDETGPVVTGSVPADEAVEVATNTPLVVNFNEPLKSEQNFAEVVRLYFWDENYQWWGAGWTQLEVAPTLSADRKSVSLAPVAPLSESTRYMIQSSGQQDDFGNSGYNYFAAEFVTIDHVAPVIETWKAGYNVELDGLTTVRSRMSMQNSYTDSASGVNTAAVIVTMDGVRVTNGVNISPSNVYYQPPAALAAGSHTINIKVVDKAGNFSEKSATFTIDNTVTITSVVPASGSKHGGTLIRINGSGLENSDQTRPQVFVGGNAATFEQFYNSEGCDFGRCLSVKVPAGTSGPATVEVRTDHGVATLDGGFTYEPDPRTPFVVEPDTELLWHLDEIFDYGECSYSPDAGPHHIDISCYAIWDLSEGRFKSGTSNSNLSAGRWGQDTDTGRRLAFTGGGFTLEGWFKNDPATSPIEQESILMGRGNLSAQVADYGLRILPDGALRAQVFNQSGTAWEATLEPAVFAVNDNEWHSVAMVVERGTEATQNRLVIYVDGEERASAQAPADFGSIRNTNDYRFISKFVGMTDELRVSSTAHTAEQIRQTYQNNVLKASIVTPRSFERGAATEISVTGYKLEDVSVALNTPDGNPVPDAQVQVVGSSANLLRLSVTAGMTAPLGDVSLVLSGSSGQTATVNALIVAPRPFVSATDTLLLWHLDEHGTNYQQNLRILDSGPQIINGTVQYYNTYTAGKFGGSIDTSVNADDDRGLLAFRNNSFTLNYWVKGGNYRVQERTLRRGALYSQNDDFYVEILNSGGLRAVLYNDAGQVWQAEAAPQGFDIYDKRWHLVTVVVERGDSASQHKLTLYADGEARSVTTAPANFGPVRSTLGSRLRITSPYGNMIDEVLISNRASTPAQVKDAWIGRDSISYFAAPRFNQTAKTNRVEQSETGAVNSKQSDTAPRPARRDATIAPPNGGRGVRKETGIGGRE